MKRVCAITLFAAVLAVVAVSGCTGLFDGPVQTTPVPTVYGPVPSPLPTPTPTPTPGLAIAHSKSSNDVYIITPSADYKFIDNGKTLDGKQYENITLFVVNDGTQTAKNIKLIITVIDERSMNTLLYQSINVGDLERGGVKPMNFKTDTHDSAILVKVSIEVRWGDNDEYYNPIIKEKVRSFPL